MRELSEALAREADRIRPRPDLDDVLRRAGRRRRRRRSAAALVMVVAAVLAVGVAAAVRRDGGQTISAALAEQPAAVDIAALGGPSIAGAGPDASYRASTLERVDRESGSGDWTLVVRPADGRFGDGSITVTYRATVGPGFDGQLHADDYGDVHRTSLVRDAGSGSVLVTGAGVGDGVFERVAEAVRIVDGRPVIGDEVLTGPGAVALVAAGPTHPALVAEARYGCDSLGEADVLGALCYAGLTTSPGFESALGGGFTPGPDLDGRPTAVSSVGGGNATLAWEPFPGVIAFVGYSGALPGPDQVAALHRLATRFELLTPREWAATAPQVVEQTNSWTN